jgi:SAM-dependent methyltransferase
MSGFSSEWLALREAADHRARASRLTAQLITDFASRDNVRILDLGSGTGSNLRALAPALGKAQDWILVDENKDLLNHAYTVLREWADYAEGHKNNLSLYYGEQIIKVAFLPFDLRDGLAPLLNPPCDLVTASALCDLVSPNWIDKVAADLAARNIPFYTVLTYDGRMQWFPEHADDAWVHEAFNAHQMSDKGFGPASGPQATELLLKAFSRHDYHCDSADSPWIINRVDEAALLQALGEGIAEATATIRPDKNLSKWREALENRRSVLIGHLDFYAVPKKS